MLRKEGFRGIYRNIDVFVYHDVKQAKTQEKLTMQNIILSKVQKCEHWAFDMSYT